MNSDDLKLLNDLANAFGENLPSAKDILELGITTTSLFEAINVTTPALTEEKETIDTNE